MGVITICHGMRVTRFGMVRGSERKLKAMKVEMDTL
jgi:hypothetical protein